MLKYLHSMPTFWSEVKWNLLICVRLCATHWTVVHEVLQASILEWIPFPFSRGSSEPRDRTQVSCIAGGFFTSWTSREAHFLETFNQNWVLNFVKSFLCIYWDDRMVFIFQFVNMVYHIGWFVYIEESLHPWDKAHLIMMYELLSVLLDSICWSFFEDFCISVQQWYWPVIFFFFFFLVASLSGFGISVMVPS